MSELLDQLDPRVLAYLIQIGRLFLWLLLLAVIFTPLERLFALHPNSFSEKMWLRTSSITSLAA